MFELCSLMYYLRLITITCAVIRIVSTNDPNPAHMKPFGTVGHLIAIEEINGKYPNIFTFFTQYIPRSEPFVSRQVLVNDIKYDIWQTNERLEHEIDDLSKINIYIESVEHQQRTQMKFQDFLDRFEKDHLFFADNMPEGLRKYFTVPQLLQCEEVLPTLQTALLIINGINTSPLMFNEEQSLLLCLYRGNKRLVLVNTHAYPDVRQIFLSNNHRTPVNPERVDLHEYPEFENVDYYVTNITAGDCVFIPNGWIFQERSLDSTISTILNINHKHALSVDPNEVQTCSTSDTTDATFTLDEIDWSAMDYEPQNLREVIMNLINSKSNTFAKWQETFSKYFSFNIASDPETKSIFDEFYGIIDVNGDGEVTAIEIEQINGAHQQHISDILYEMMKIVHEKQKNNTNKSTSQKDESLVDTYEDEDLNENVQSENYKTDL